MACLCLTVLASCQEDSIVDDEQMRLEHIREVQSLISDHYASKGFFNLNEDNPFEFISQAGGVFDVDDRQEFRSFLSSIGFKSYEVVAIPNSNGRTDCESHRETFYDGWLCWVSVTTYDCSPAVHNCWTCYLWSGPDGCNSYY